jgi:hypothetical protein
VQIAEPNPDYVQLEPRSQSPIQERGEVPCRPEDRKGRRRSKRRKVEADLGPSDILPLLGQADEVMLLWFGGLLS